MKENNNNISETNEEKDVSEINNKTKENSEHIKIRDMVFIAVFTAIIAALSQVSIPMPNMVPITLQTFAVSLAGYFLGAKKGVASVGVYVMLGAVGAPVFASFKGGFAVLIGYTGGFIWGFIPLALLCGILADKKLGMAFGVLGVVVCHLLGTLQYMALSKNGFFQSLMLVSLPYILKDLLLIPAAFFIAKAIKNRIRI
ncbi:MAG: biotin transporter BioY [Eubacteriales bacterium]